MLEYVKIMWETFGWIGFGTFGGVILYNLLLIYSVYRLEKQVKMLMKDKEERDKEDDEIRNYFKNGGKSPKVITEIGTSADSYCGEEGILAHSHSEKD